MTVRSTARRASYAFLCLVPIVSTVAVAIRALRIPGVYQAVGWILFVTIVIAAWVLGLRGIGSAEEERRSAALAGGLLLVPFALTSLLWVGLATPWDATPPENVMRYLVLLAGVVAVAGGLMVLREALRQAGERLLSSLGATANLLAGAAYVVWLSFQVGVHVLRVQSGQVPQPIVVLADIYDVLLFVACLLTYLATAAYAESLWRVGWLGRGGARAYVMVSGVALLFLVMRGVSFPDPTAGAAPWFTRPGFIAGIPAVPWIMPFLLGVVLLRRAGDARSESAELPRVTP